MEKSEFGDAIGYYVTSVDTDVVTNAHQSFEAMAAAITAAVREAKAKGARHGVAPAERVPPDD